MYGGSYDGAKLRSLSGKKLDCNTNAQTEISRAAANGTGWTIISWSRRNLIESLLTLISKSENFQAKFGQGVCSTYVNDSSKDYGKVVTGMIEVKSEMGSYRNEMKEIREYYIRASESLKQLHKRMDRIDKIIDESHPHQYIEE